MNLDELIKNKKLKPVSEAFDKAKEITVSVFCLTYNQEKYIEDALDSFLMQLVDFNVEIVIHDDASTDSTPKILKDYQKKYPDVVKVFFEEENQYSRVGDTIEIERIHIKNTRGKYIASCEGDDYWVDQYKLLLQVHALETNPNCCFSTHRVQVVDLRNENNNCILPNSKLNGGVIRQNDFIDMVNNDYPFQTSCYFMRKSVYERFLDEYPVYAQMMPTSDEAVMYYMGNSGDVFFIDRTMSCWRKFTENSWNVANLVNSNSKQQNERRRKFAASIMEYYRYSGEKYKSCIERANRLLINTYLSEGSLKELFKNKSIRKTLKRQGLIRYYKLKIKSLLKNQGPLEGV